MNNPKPVALVMVGSIGIDTIETPAEKRQDVLGGSLSYACAAASFFAPVGMVGVVGTDFPDEYTALYRSFGIDLAGLQQKPGKTFRWSGVYEQDMNQRRTISTDLNVFADFAPVLPADYRRAPFLFLANIDPELQLHVMRQVESPRFVAADTMDLWIHTKRAPLMKLIAAVHLLTLNESEARLLAGESNLLKAARKIMGWGPAYLLIKKGEHGALLFSADGTFVMPAFPLDEVCDPTGAGDTFAGGLMGYLAAQGRVERRALRYAMAYGTILASFGVQAFGLDRLRQVDRQAIDRRLDAFRGMLLME